MPLATASFTRPANTTVYDAGDLVANDVDAADVVAMTLSWGNLNGNVRKLVLTTTNATITNGQFQVWLFKADPSDDVDNGDNTALAGVPFSKLIGVVAITLSASMGAVGGWGQATLDPGLIQTGQTIYALLEARGTYTPASAEVFTLDAYLEP